MPSNVICYHCGDDYAAAYWMGNDPGDHPYPLAKADPRVCHNCRRDTNPDAQPSQWVPPDNTDPITYGPPSLYVVRKTCYKCSREWAAKSFAPQPENVEALPGICGPCCDADDAVVKALTARQVPAHARPAPATLNAPRRPPIYGDD